MTKRGTARALLMAGMASVTLACAGLPTEAAAPTGAQALREGRGQAAIATLSPPPRAATSFRVTPLEA